MSTEIPVSRTKIVVPGQRPEILHRPRLLAHFDDLLDRKLIIVAAPAGYGKTSLLVDFARQSEMPVCWFSLDALDTDPQRFCIYLIAAIHERFPKFGHLSKIFLGSLINLEQDSERLLATLVNEIDAQIDQNFALVVDDYQFVDAIPEIRALFSRFIALVGENCHIILSSRRLPTLPDITLMVARQQVGGFDLEELAFKPNEIRSFFDHTYGISLEDAIVDSLVRKTEGWITGLQLSASSISSDLPDLTRASQLAGVDLDGYLDEQVLALQPPKIRKFLLNTALLEEFDANLCEAVFGKDDWKPLIRKVRQDNLFVLPVGPGGQWLRYHHIFQEFLLERVHEEEPENARAILVRLAKVYEQRQDWEKAYAIYHKSGDLDKLAALIELAGASMLLSGRLITLRTWFEELSNHPIEERPVLLSLNAAFLCTLGEGRNALSLLERAIPEFQKNELFSDLALALVRRAAAHRLVGDYANSLQDADQALRLSENNPNQRAIYAEAERFKGVSLHNLGQTSDAIHFLEDALRVYTELKEMQSVAQTQIDLGITFRACGNYPAASNAYEQALAIWRKDNNLSSQSNVLNSLGVLLHSQGKYEAAIQTLEEGLVCAKNSGSPVQEAFLLASLGDVYADLDEYESADQAYSNAIEIAHQISYQFLTNYLYLVQVRLARRQGQIKKAQRYLNRAEILFKTTDSSYERGLFHLESGCLQLVEGRSAVAKAALEQALDFFIKGDLTLEAILSRIWLTAAHLSAGKIAEARACLLAALEKGQAEALYFPTLQAVRQARVCLANLQKDAKVGPVLRPWLETAAQTEAQLPLLRKRLRRLLQTVPIQDPHLTIQAFGKGRVKVNGKLVTSAQWKTSSVKGLFFYILAAIRPLSKEEIGAELWPELDTSQMRLRFKNEMYRLRHALGQEVIQFENDHYHFNRFLDYEYDVENFTSQLIKAEAATQIKEKSTYLRSAIDLRVGPFLQDIDATWILPEREHLDQVCVDALAQLVEADRKDNNFSAALRTCQEAIKIAPYREDLMRLAMQIHADRGDRLAVIWQYQACREALLTELGVNPSKETETLYQKLIAS
jgi:LuxR family transcriptional regulator, maltose regulon positive regulatory protein